MARDSWRALHDCLREGGKAWRGKACLRQQLSLTGLWQHQRRRQCYKAKRKCKHAPIAVAVNPATDTIYVANSQSNNLNAIDGPTDSVTATISVGTSPFGIAVDPQTNFIYLANAGNSPAGDPGSVTVIIGATNTVLGGGMPHYEFLCHNCKRLYTKILSLIDYEEGQILCPYCGSKEVEQCWSAFSAITAKKSARTVSGARGTYAVRQLHFRLAPNRRHCVRPRYHH